MRKTLLATLVIAFVAGAGVMGGADAAGEVDKARGKALAHTSSSSYMAGNGPMTARERGEYARDFVEKWGPYFKATYRQPVSTWAQKEARVIGTADSQNLRAAMEKTTLEAAMMTLRGHRVSDDQAIDFLARQPERKAGELPAALGDLAKDLVYTPLNPCRIFDTRVTGVPIKAGSTRSFDTKLWGAFTGYEHQGGQGNTDCGLIPGAAAVAINIAAPLPESGGFLTVYPYGTSRPLASNLDYHAGELKNNEMVVRTGQGDWDISIYAHGKTHVVGDVVGYYAAPVAGPLDCTKKHGQFNVPAGSFTNATNQCPAGYSATGVALSWIGAHHTGKIDNTPGEDGRTWHATARNPNASNQILDFHMQCCRVPGR